MGALGLERLNGVRASLGVGVAGLELGLGFGVRGYRLRVRLRALQHDHATRSL